MSSSRKPKNLGNPYEAVPQDETGRTSRLKSKAVVRLLALGGFGAGAAGLQVAGAGAAHADPFGGGDIFGGGDLSNVDFGFAEDIQIPEMTSVPDIPEFDASTIAVAPESVNIPLDIPPPAAPEVVTPPAPEVVTPPAPEVVTPPAAAPEVVTPPPENVTPPPAPENVTPPAPEVVTPPPAAAEVVTPPAPELSIDRSVQVTPMTDQEITTAVDTAEATDTGEIVVAETPTDIPFPAPPTTDAPVFTAELPTTRSSGTGDRSVIEADSGTGTATPPTTGDQEAGVPDQPVDSATDNGVRFSPMTEEQLTLAGTAAEQVTGGDVTTGTSSFTLDPTSSTDAPTYTISDSRGILDTTAPLGDTSDAVALPPPIEETPASRNGSDEVIVTPFQPTVDRTDLGEAIQSGDVSFSTTQLPADTGTGTGSTAPTGSGAADLGSPLTVGVDRNEDGSFTLPVDGGTAPSTPELSANRTLPADTGGRTLPYTGFSDRASGTGGALYYDTDASGDRTGTGTVGYSTPDDQFRVNASGRVTQPGTEPWQQPGFGTEPNGSGSGAVSATLGDPNRTGFSVTGTAGVQQSAAGDQAGFYQGRANLRLGDRTDPVDGNLFVERQGVSDLDTGVSQTTNRGGAALNLPLGLSVNADQSFGNSANFPGYGSVDTPNESRLYLGYNSNDAGGREERRTDPTLFDPRNPVSNGDRGTSTADTTSTAASGESGGFGTTQLPADLFRYDPAAEPVLGNGAGFRTDTPGDAAAYQLYGAPTDSTPTPGVTSRNADDLRSDAGSGTSNPTTTRDGDPVLRGFDQGTLVATSLANPGVVSDSPSGLIPAQDTRGTQDGDTADTRIAQTLQVPSSGGSPPAGDNQLPPAPAAPQPRSQDPGSFGDPSVFWPNQPVADPTMRFEFSPSVRFRPVEEYVPQWSTLFAPINANAEQNFGYSNALRGVRIGEFNNQQGQASLYNRRVLLDQGVQQGDRSRQQNETNAANQRTLNGATNQLGQNVSGYNSAAGMNNGNQITDSNNANAADQAALNRQDNVAIYIENGTTAQYTTELQRILDRLPAGSTSADPSSQRGQEGQAAYRDLVLLQTQGLPPRQVYERLVAAHPSVLEDRSGAAPSVVPTPAATVSVFNPQDVYARVENGQVTTTPESFVGERLDLIPTPPTTPRYTADGQAVADAADRVRNSPDAVTYSPDQVATNFSPQRVAPFNYRSNESIQNEVAQQTELLTGLGALSVGTTPFRAPVAAYVESPLGVAFNTLYGNRIDQLGNEILPQQSLNDTESATQAAQSLGLLNQQIGTNDQQNLQNLQSGARVTQAGFDQQRRQAIEGAAFTLATAERERLNAQQTNAGTQQFTNDLNATNRSDARALNDLGNSATAADNMVRVLASNAAYLPEEQREIVLAGIRGTNGFDRPSQLGALRQLLGEENFDAVITMQTPNTGATTPRLLMETPTSQQQAPTQQQPTAPTVPLRGANDTDEIYVFSDGKIGAPAWLTGGAAVVLDRQQAEDAAYQYNRANDLQPGDPRFVRIPAGNQPAPGTPELTPGNGR